MQSLIQLIQSSLQGQPANGLLAIELMRGNPELQELLSLCEGFRGGLVMGSVKLLPKTLNIEVANFLKDSTAVLDNFICRFFDANYREDEYFCDLLGGDLEHPEILEFVAQIKAANETKMFA